MTATAGLLLGAANFILTVAVLLLARRVSRLERMATATVEVVAAHEKRIGR